MSWKLNDVNLFSVYGPEPDLTPPDEYEACEEDWAPEPSEPDFPPDIGGVQWPYTLDDFQIACGIRPWE